ncbi:MAG: pyridoxal phosphate-dependent aminotransferase [Ignavibacteria bacterium]|nr:pyridoxal phosphate-dependent aminotransferase [Ignavibacteria bacterium]
MNTPIDFNIVKQKIEESKLPSVGKASIREVRSLINSIEKASGKKFIRMEMGVPGLPASEIGVNAEIEALKKGVANAYPEIEGITELKREISRFIKLFLDVDVQEKSCIPCTGSTSGSFVTFLTLARADKNKDTVLFLDPGFPVHKMQTKVLGINQTNIDVYKFRGEKLREVLEEKLKAGNISCLLYSNPNNPSWICFTDKELRIIGELCTKYDVIPIEDLAYFNMDFRKDYSKPGKDPHQPSVAKYCDNYMILVSGSKIFSYAGQRIGCIIISDKLFNREYPDLLRFFSSATFGHTMIYGAAYAVSAGVTHSTQYAFAALLKAVNDGELDFVKEVKIYGERAKKMKKMFLNSGFRIVYDHDDGEPIADGFYFTVAYDGYSGEDLIEQLLYYGISAISLSNTGSLRKEGIRACVSLVHDSQLPELEERLKLFHENHKQ